MFLALVPTYTTTPLTSHSLLTAGATSGLLLVCGAVAQLALPRSDSHRAQTVGLTLLVLGSVGLFAATALHSLALLLIAVAVAGPMHPSKPAGSSISTDSAIEWVRLRAVSDPLHAIGIQRDSWCPLMSEIRCYS
jgi:hypothetical protein